MKTSLSSETGAGLPTLSLAPTPMHVFPALDEPRRAWSILGVARTATSDQLDDAWSVRVACARNAKEEAVLRQAWKALRDERYRAMTLAGASWTELADAGLFDDGLSPTAWAQLFAGLERVDQGMDSAAHHKRLPAAPSPLLWQTPWGGLDRDVARQHALPVVLLAMGSFAPFHEGHRAMLHAAQAAAVEAGWGVVGGFVSPSHEAYVGKKANGQAAWNGEARAQSLREALRGEALWSVDPWEMRAPCPLNFSDVALRLRLYLQKIDPSLARVRVAVVFGGDNAGFARAFAHEGLAIAVERNKKDGRARATVAQAQQGNAGLLWACPAAQTQSLSSTQLRKDFWRQKALEGGGVGTPVWQPGRGKDQKDPPLRDPSHLGEQLLRDDGARAWSHWVEANSSEKDKQRWEHAWSVFKTDIVTALQRAWSSNETRPTWVIEDVHQQAQWAARAGRGRRWLSLDAGCSEDCGFARWDLSRVFACSDTQAQALRWAARPEHASFEVQALALANKGVGAWTAVDDDVSSGGTLRAAQAGLPAGHVLRGAVTLTGASGRQRHGGQGWWLYDVMDLRDWLLGATGGGLTVELPDGTTARVPYVAPWVNLCARAGFPATGVEGFTQDWARANLRFFDTIPRAICVQDFPQPAQRAWLSMGWGPSSSAQELVRWVGCQGH